MMHEMKRLIKKYWGKKSGVGSASPIGSLAVQMLQLWTNSFSPRTYPHFSQAYYRLLEKGIRFPPPTDENAQPIQPDVPVVVKASKDHIFTSPSRVSNAAIPRNVSSTLDAAGESLNLLFSITEDPNAPVPEDLLNPIMTQLRAHSDKIVELINANMDNENAVRRLLEVNDQIETALKRVSMHHNVVEDSDSDDSDSSTPTPESARSDSVPNKSKSSTGISKSNKSASAPNVAAMLSSPSNQKLASAAMPAPSSSSGGKKRTSRKSRTSAAPQPTNAVFDFFGSPTPQVSTSTPNTSSTIAFDAFDFGHTGSAFAPSATQSTSNDWANFGPSHPAQSPVAFVSTSSHTLFHGAALGDAFGTAAPTNGSAFASQPFPAFSSTSFPSNPAVASQPLSPTISSQASTNGSYNSTTNNDTFNPFALPSNQVSTGSQTLLATNPSPIQPSSTTERLASTFGKYWTTTNPPAPTSASLGADPFSSPQSSSNLYSTTPSSPFNGSTPASAAPTSINGRSTGSVSSGTSNPTSTNPFL
jgi:hypothetical protein